MTERSFSGSKVALFLGERLLVQLRDNRPDVAWAGHWDLPGGGRDGTETPWETLSREVDEEVGLAMEEAEVLWRMQSTSGDKPDAIVWFYVARMPADKVGEVLFGDEGEAWALMAPDRFMGLTPVVPYFPARLSRYLELAGGWGAPVAPADWD